MKRYLKFALWLLVAAFASLGASRIFLAVLNHESRKAAEALLRDVRPFKVGEATLADLRPVLDRYDWIEHKGPDELGKCNGPRYQLGQDGRDVTGGYEVLARMPWWAFGVPVIRWGLVAVLDFDEGKLCTKVFAAQVWIPAHFGADVWEPSQSEKTIMGVEESSRNSWQSHEMNYFLGINRRSYDLLVMMTPQATVQERSKAFNFDLSCLTSFGVCKRCQVMPSVWRDAAIRTPKTNWPVWLHQELEDPDCRAAALPSAPHPVEAGGSQ
jgi:hypothetical protein